MSRTGPGDRGNDTGHALDMLWANWVWYIMTSIDTLSGKGPKYSKYLNGHPAVLPSLQALLLLFPLLFSPSFLLLLLFLLTSLRVPSFSFKKKSPLLREITPLSYTYFLFLHIAFSQGAEASLTVCVLHSPVIPQRRDRILRLT